MDASVPNTVNNSELTCTTNTTTSEEVPLFQNNVWIPSASSPLESHKFPVLLLAAQEAAALRSVRDDEWQEVASICVEVTLLISTP